MTTPPLEDALRPAPVDAASLSALHDRLTRAAERDGLLEVAYTVHPSPIGPLLLVATPHGVLRIAFEREGHDAVLGLIAARVSPRILKAPARLAELAQVAEW